LIYVILLILREIVFYVVTSKYKDIH